MITNFSPAAVELIKEFEGLELTSYPDPGTGGDPYTVGYGHTGPDVTPWMEISESRAEEFLIDDMQWAADTINSLVRVDLTQGQFDALTSFVFNVGTGAFSQSTLLARLNAGEAPGPVIAQELPRWNKGGNGVMAGLVRRREAEVALALSDIDDEPLDEPATDNTISLVNAATYFKGATHQVEAFEYLEDLLTLEELDEFARLYRAGSQSAERVLKAPYFYQLDNGPTGGRECFSSTCAMLLETLRPGTLSGKNGDVEYLSVLSKYGDTTDAAAQIATLREFGVEAEFVMNASFATLEEQLRKGIPVPTGWLHYGTPEDARGGGHWTLVIGLQGDKGDGSGGKVIHHDPNGEANMVAGGYVRSWPTDGKAVAYSRKNWGPRWEVEGPGTGWAVIAR